MLLKNNTTSENQLSIMQSRVKSLATKYNQLVTQLRVHGVDFLLATGKSAATKALEQRLRKKNQNGEAKLSGLYSSLDIRAAVTS